MILKFLESGPASPSLFEKAYLIIYHSWKGNPLQISYQKYLVTLFTDELEPISQIEQLNAEQNFFSGKS